jgi:hypothetical protein
VRKIGILLKNLMRERVNDGRLDVDNPSNWSSTLKNFLADVDCGFPFDYLIEVRRVESIT